MKLSKRKKKMKKIFLEANLSDTSAVGPVDDAAAAAMEISERYLRELRLITFWASRSSRLPFRCLVITRADRLTNRDR